MYKKEFVGDISMTVDLFIAHIKEKVEQFFSGINEQHYIKHVSHLDADGLSSAAIIVDLLFKQGRTFTTTIMPTLDQDTVQTIFNDKYTHYIFTDFGSGQLSLLHKYLADKRVLILDHHDVEQFDIPDTWIHINPKMFNVDGNKEISGAGVAYLAAAAQKQKLPHLALLGALGDVQGADGFVGPNQMILEEAKNKGMIMQKESLKYFGIARRPLAYLIEYSDDIYVPGFSKVKGGGLKLLNDVGIHNELGGKEILMHDLSEVEYKRLVQAITHLRKDEEKPDDIFQECYLLQTEHAPVKDLKEFATLLNACGRMKKYAIGIGACLGDVSFKELALAVEKAYKQKISESLRWYSSHEHEKGEGYLLINGTGAVSSTVIGTVASIVARKVEYGTFIVALSRTDDGATTKVSVRRAGDVEDCNLNELVRSWCTGFPSQAGGHIAAAGAVFASEHETEFLDIVRKHFGKNDTAKVLAADVL